MINKASFCKTLAQSQEGNTEIYSSDTSFALPINGMGMHMRMGCLCYGFQCRRSVSDYAYRRSVVEAFRKLQDFSPIYKYVGDPSLLSAINGLGGIKGKEILDFGCGLGMYSMMFVKLGAKFVLGTDISPECVDIAMQKSNSAQVKFAVADCGDQELNLGKEFDLGVCINVFHYAKTVEALQQFANNLFKHVKPGGSVVLSLLNGRSNWLYDYPILGSRKYMFNLRKPSPVAEDSDICTFDFIFEGKCVLSVPYYHYSNDTYERVVLSAGFTRLLWSKWEVCREGRSSFPEGFWKEFDDAQPCLILSASKP